MIHRPVDEMRGGEIAGQVRLDLLGKLATPQMPLARHAPPPWMNPYAGERRWYGSVALYQCPVASPPFPQYATTTGADEAEILREMPSTSGRSPAAGLGAGSPAKVCCRRLMRSRQGVKAHAGGGPFRGCPADRAPAATAAALRPPVPGGQGTGSRPRCGRCAAYR